MKKTEFLTGTASLAALLLSGCITDGNMNYDPDHIRFAASINDTQAKTTRASDKTWASTDAIGVYMLGHGTTLNGGGLIDGAANVKYVPGTGVNANKFIAGTESEALEYPAGGGSVDFVAYYPWKSTITNYQYSVDVSDQSNLPAIDFLYASTATVPATATGFSSGTPSLEFDHKLVQLIFEVTDREGEPVDDITATISGMKTTGVFNLSAGGSVSSSGNSADIDIFNTSNDDYEAVFEGIVLPANGIDFIVKFDFPDSGTDEVQAELRIDGANLEAGHSYTYEVELTPPATPDPGSARIINTTINPWISHTENKEVPKTKMETYFFETFGAGTMDSYVLIEDYSDLDVGADERYTTGAHVTAQPGETNRYLEFNVTAGYSVGIFNLPEGYSDITISFKFIAHFPNPLYRMDNFGFSAGNDLLDPVTVVPTVMTYMDRTVLPFPSEANVSIKLPDNSTFFNIWLPNDGYGDPHCYLDDLKITGRRIVE